MRRPKQKKDREQRHEEGGGGGVDGLSYLPDDILGDILSRLDTRTAASTSVLSRRWRHLWSSHLADLKFDVKELFDRRYSSKIKVASSAESIIRERRQKSTMSLFMRSVGGFFNGGGAAAGGQRTIRKLHLNFFPMRRYELEIHSWISVALDRGVKVLHLTEERLRQTCISKEHYIFPCRLFGSDGKGSSVVELHLSGLNFHTPVGFDGFRSLSTLSLALMSLPDYRIHDLLLCCKGLERLRLSFCDDLYSLKASPPDSKLKELVVRNCRDLRRLDVAAGRLQRLHYDGRMYSISFQSVPCLERVWLHFNSSNETKSLRHNLEKLSTRLRHVKDVALWIEKVKVVRFGFPVFNNMRNLTLALGKCLNGADLALVASFLRACPFLEVIQISLEECIINQSSEMEWSPNEMQWVPSEMQWAPGEDLKHLNLKEASLYNFKETPAEINLAIFILKGAITLESMNIFRGILLAGEDLTWSHRPHLDPLSEEKKTTLLEMLRNDISSNAKISIA